MRETMTIAATALLGAAFAYSAQPVEKPVREFTRQFGLSSCAFSTTGRTPYFILEPGYTLTLKSKTDQLIVKVLEQTAVVGGIETRIVEERHTEGNTLIEVSRNYFAICSTNNSVYYFGESVDNYKNGKLDNHNGAWRHGASGATAGLAMPALPLLGARYYQEIAPGVALDRAEVMSLDGTLRTPYDMVERVLVTKESSPLEPGVEELKSYGAGIGLVRDDDMLLMSVTPGAPRR